MQGMVNWCSFSGVKQFFRIAPETITPKQKRKQNQKARSRIKPKTEQKQPPTQVIAIATVTACMQAWLSKHVGEGK